VPDYESDILLLWAIIERAMLDALGSWHVSSEDTDRWEKESQEWLGLFRFNEEDHTPEPFTAQWLCNHLNIDLPALRDSLEDAIIMGRTMRASMRKESMQTIILEKARLGQRISQTGPADLMLRYQKNREE
jgi:hypothetical protein